MDYQKMRTELLTDPLGWNYAGMTDAAAADKLNATNTGRTLPRATVPVYEVKEAIVLSDFTTITPAQREYLTMLFNSEALYNKAGNIRAALASIFSGKTTLTNLSALQTYTVSRADELAIGGTPTAGDVAMARAGIW